MATSSLSLSLHLQAPTPCCLRRPYAPPFMVIRIVSPNVPATTSLRKAGFRPRAASSTDGAAAALPRSNGGLAEELSRRVEPLRSFLPGGRWWKLPQEESGVGKVEVEGEGKVGVSVSSAFRRVWEMLRDDKWVVFAGFAALVIASVSEVAEETFSLVRTVRVYGTEKQEIGRYTAWLQKLADVNLRQSATHGLWSFSFNSLYHCTRIIALIVGAIYIRKNSISAEQLTKFILYCEWMIFSIWRIGDNWSNLMQSIGASEKVFQLMDLIPCQQFTLKGVKLDQLIGIVEFKNIQFHYPSRKQVLVLEDVNFSARSNEVVAIVGISGSGKSTLVNLLLRLYEPTSGQIFVDGYQLADLDVEWLRERIGFVGQEPRLFHMDVESNIKYGCTREVTREEVESAAKRAFAHEFILALPDGYKTLVDNDLLSGGQKQRIAIARALLRDPSILIFDEATSALDAESEYYVTEVLRGVRDGSLGKKTCLVIAHRLSTIRIADKIVVMEGGRIVEMGSHSELLRQDGLYARLTKKQSDGMIALNN